MFNSKLIKAFNWIFSFLLIISLVPFVYYQGEKQYIILIVMLLAIVASTISYIPPAKITKNKDEYYYAYVSGYLSHIVIILVIFLIALWELSQTGMIGVWFYVLLLTTALVRPVIFILIKAFHK